jgi:hypothetical protein
LSNLASESASPSSAMKGESVRDTRDFNHLRVMDNSMSSDADSWGYYTEDA